MAALIESRRDTLALRRRIGGGSGGWVAHDMAADAEGLDGGGNRRALVARGGRGDGGGKLVVAASSLVGPSETDFSGRDGGGFALRDMDAAAAAAAAAALGGGGRYASSDGDGGSELFGSVDSDGLPFLLRPAAGEAEGPGGWEEGSL